MTSQEPTYIVMEDAQANSGEMELAKPSAIPHEQSRLYQLEMFEASMARNIIVVVVLLHPADFIILTLRADGHWQRKNSHVNCPPCVTDVVGRRLAQLSPILYTDSDSAVMRIKAELERCPPHKVR